MTPFMIQVAELIGADPGDDAELPVPATRPVMARPVGVGNDLYVAIRGLTEELVCEVNALLADEDDHMSVVDDVVGTELMFTVFYRGRAAVVTTSFVGGQTYGRVVADGLDNSEPRELAGTESVQDLLLLLLLESDTPRHPAH